ncbi:hypothetical protein ACBJ59_10780 [Nonomuraea sp. MTCD27]|uniref:hypothetical protein n=1 Tax=Nonomuraea sp. MTCD27 TaxID=1676747 RepID=UPI0035C15DF0
MTALWVSIALLVCAVGHLVSGRLIFLLNHREQTFKTIDFVILGAIALAALLAAYAVPSLIFYDLVREAHR